MRKRLQHRISLDPGMGALYEWLASLDPATRSREAVYLMRLGAEVHLGMKSVQLSLAVHDGMAPPSSLQAARPSDVPAGGDSAVTMAAWNLGAMCTPPPKSK